MNRVEFIGRLTKDPELSTTNSGIELTRFSLAVDKIHTSEDDADFFNIVAWRGLAENICKYCKKGSKVYIAGALQNRSYDASDGTKRLVTEIVANECEFL